MPIPTPRSDEDRNGFISRCIRVLSEEGDRYTPDQVQAICYRQWKEGRMS
jgi:hypothetical protein